MKEDMQLYQVQMAVIETKLAACPADLTLVREELKTSQRVFTRNLVNRMRLKAWFERAALSEVGLCIQLWAIFQYINLITSRLYNI